MTLIGLTNQTSERVYQFSGHHRTPSDGVLVNGRDPELWDESGDCLVFLDTNIALYRVSTSLLRVNQSKHLLNSLRTSKRSSSTTSCDSSDSGYESCHITNLPQSTCEVRITSPIGLSADEISTYHATTRNYFAYLLAKPLVGKSLGGALRDVWQRIQRWHGEEADADIFIHYCQSQGYLELVGRPYNATALLAFAESTRLRSVWINAFAHCVAMHDRIDKDTEYDSLSNTTKAMITKASLRMELHIRQVVRTVGNFLEGELNSERLGLSKPARDHLDHFRRFLHSFFLDKLGFFPPTDSEDNFDKDIWRDIHDDFTSLYDYLVDAESVNEVLGNRGVIGGVCVHQNVDAFNQRHGFEPLSHPLPLLPDLTPKRRTTESQVSIRSFKLVRLDSEFRPSSQQALSDASNSRDADLHDRPILQDYIRFERQKLEEKLSIAEARKVRWLLIYATLQMLKSIVLAPEEVTEAHSAPYPLCISTSNCPDWTIMPASLPRAASAASLKRTSSGLALPIDEDADRISIHPDCEADNAQDFFLSMGRRASIIDKSEDEIEPQSATRSIPPLSRSLSIRTSVHSSMNALQKSVIGSLSRRNSMRRSGQLVPKRVASLPDIVVADTETAPTGDECTTLNPLEEFNFDLTFSSTQATETIPGPLLEDHELDMITPVERCHTPPSQLIDEEQLSPASDTSRRSSTHSECETPITEPSSRSNSTRESKLMGKLAPLEEDSILVTLNQRPHMAFHTSSSTTSLNAGCYKPSGFAQPIIAPISKFAAPARRQVYEKRNERTDADQSSTSLWMREGKRPLHNRYGRSKSHTADRSGSYTYGDLP